MAGLTRLATIAVGCVAAHVVAAESAPRFTELKGSFVSSVQGGCRLKLERDGRYSLSCGSRPIQTGQAIPFGDGFSVRFADRNEAGPPAAPLEGLPVPWPSPGRPADVGERSLQDPTVGPFVVEMPKPSGWFWLEPVRWGERLYLVQDGAYRVFCKAIRAGVEPRKTALGVIFLRVGDHTRPVARTTPTECDAFK
jgi:hypothetical protein